MTDTNIETCHEISQFVAKYAMKPTFRKVNGQFIQEETYPNTDGSLYHFRYVDELDDWFLFHEKNGKVSIVNEEGGVK